jgi:uncharacterized protein YjaG (DUF416 family)
METFDERHLKNVLARLEPWKRIALMALNCERMLPNFNRYASDSDFGSPHVLRRGLDLAWTWLESDQLPIDLNSILVLRPSVVSRNTSRRPDCSQRTAEE